MITSTEERGGVSSMKTYPHIWVGYIFYPIRKNVHKLWWKHIYRINSFMRIEKVMWLCAMRWDNFTNQWTDLVHSIHMLLYMYPYGVNNLCHIWKLLGLYSVASPIFLVIFSATVYQELMILFSLTWWMETVLYSHMFYARCQFCAQV